MALGIPDRVDALQVAPDVLDRAADELHGMIDDVGAPVAQLAPAIAQDGLPVGAPPERMVST